MFYPDHFSCPPLEIICLSLGPLATNCYLVFNPPRPEALIIDPADSPEIILSQLQSHKLTGGIIVLTHGHCDHLIAAAHLVKQGFPLSLHAADAPMLDDLELSGAHWLGLPQEQIPAGRLLQEGDSIDLWQGNFPLQVMHTPGHSPGSICLLAKDCAFVGDLLFAGGIGRTDFPGGNDEAMRHSLQKIMALPDPTRVFSGHGPATTIGQERENNPFLDSR
jgi:hydroxyacylglutathione hydrolase